MVGWIWFVCHSFQSMFVIKHMGCQPIYKTECLKVCVYVHVQVCNINGNERFQSLFFSLNYLFLAALGLRCCVRAFSSCGKQGPLFVAAVRGLFIAMASLVAEHGLQARRLQYLWHVGSVVVARGL